MVVMISTTYLSTERDKSHDKTQIRALWWCWTVAWVGLDANSSDLIRLILAKLSADWVFTDSDNSCRCAIPNCLYSVFAAVLVTVAQICLCRIATHTQRDRDSFDKRVAECETRWDFVIAADDPSPTPSQLVADMDDNLFANMLSNPHHCFTQISSEQNWS